MRRGEIMTSLRTGCARIIPAGLAALALAAATAGAEDLPLWEAGAGIAVINFPDYRGSDHRSTWVLPFPYIVYRGEFLRADKEGVRGRFLKSDRFEINVSVNGSIPVDSEDNDARRGMPDLDPTLEIGPSLHATLWRSANRKRALDLRLPLRAVIATDLSRVHHEGWMFQPHLNLDVNDFMGTPRLDLGLLAGPIFSTRQYNNYFYAVAPAYATPTRPAYTPGEGYAGTQLLASLTRRYKDVWIGGFARFDTLRGAAFESSPLVRDREYFAAGFAVYWILGKSKTTVTNSER